MKNRYIPSVYKEVGVEPEYFGPKRKHSKRGDAMSEDHMRLCKPGVWRRRRKKKA